MDDFQRIKKSTFKFLLKKIRMLTAKVHGKNNQSSPIFLQKKYYTKLILQKK